MRGLAVATCTGLMLLSVADNAEAKTATTTPAARTPASIARKLGSGIVRFGRAAVPLLAGGLTYSALSQHGTPAFLSGALSYSVANGVDFGLNPRRQREEAVVEGGKLLVGALGAGGVAHLLRGVELPSALPFAASAGALHLLKGALFDTARAGLLRISGAVTHNVGRVALARLIFGPYPE